MDLDRAMEYLEFVHERHNVWERRRAGDPQPWTSDPVLAGNKFTNVFRVLDYGSQFLLKELLDPSLPSRDILARCFLYRYTNLPATWTWWREQLGHYPVADDLGEPLCDLFAQRLASGAPGYSAAYIIHPMNTEGVGPKFNLIVKVARSMFGEGEDFTEEFLKAQTQAQRYTLLKSPRGVGEFMAMQILTDWGYSAQCGVDREDEFVVAGPGAIRGANALGAGSSPLERIHWAYRVLRGEPDVPTLPGGRKPSLMDVQNTFCEFSKYVRYKAKPQRTQPYTPVHPGPETIVLPEHW